MLRLCADGAEYIAVARLKAANWSSPALGMPDDGSSGKEVVSSCDEHSPGYPFSCPIYSDTTPTPVPALPAGSDGASGDGSSKYPASLVLGVGAALGLVVTAAVLLVFMGTRGATLQQTNLNGGRRGKAVDDRRGGARPQQRPQAIDAAGAVAAAARADGDDRGDTGDAEVTAKEARAARSSDADADADSVSVGAVSGVSGSPESPLGELSLTSQVLSAAVFIPGDCCRRMAYCTVLSPQVLGRGCNGTVVFAGMLGTRPVAVKRLMRQCYSAAEREVTPVAHTLRPAS